MPPLPVKLDLIFAREWEKSLKFLMYNTLGLVDVKVGDQLLESTMLFYQIDESFFLFGTKWILYNSKLDCWGSLEHT